jgi:hypothetical protein
MRLSRVISCLGETGALLDSLACEGRAKGEGSCLAAGLVDMGEADGTRTWPGSARVWKAGSGFCKVGRGADSGSEWWLTC